MSLRRIGVSQSCSRRRIVRAVFVDLPLDELRAYRPDVLEPDDFDAFWASDPGRGARSTPLDADVRAVDDAACAPSRRFDVTFTGYGGQPIKGWLLLPRAALPGPLPCVVEYIGYGGGRGFRSTGCCGAAPATRTW